MLSDYTRRLLEHIRAVVPAVDNVSIGTRGESATVQVLPPEQQAAAQAAIDSFDWSPAAQNAWEDGQEPERKTLRQAAAGAVADNLAYLQIATPTTAQMRAQLEALTRQNNAVIRRVVQLD